jgi:hypothetical protein
MCEVRPLQSAVPRSTAADLARVIGRFPKPDDAYLKEVERAASRTRS